MSVESLPVLLSGPLLRKVTPEILCFWWINPAPLPVRLQVFSDRSCKKTLVDITPEAPLLQRVRVGERAHICLLHISLDESLPQGQTLYYDLRFSTENGEQGLADVAPDLCYTDQPLPSFQVQMQLSEVLHGSCRKPHYPSDDGLLQVDKLLTERVAENADRPNLLIMSGDQVYVDDVAGPMLSAIHQVMDLLGLYEEKWQGAEANTTKALLSHSRCFYGRDRLLPKTKDNQDLYQSFLAGKRKPIFTSVNAQNHLITFSEMIALYTLMWSPELWQRVQVKMPELDAELTKRFRKEEEILVQFAEGLPKVRRALAHLPTYMIFDDHDVTDDWNLTREWEETAYGHPFSKRIIGNALLAYWLCQGWGNAPRFFKPLYEEAQEHLSDSGIADHDALLDVLFHWHYWHYTLPTEPKLVVLDTRTRRWRSESNAAKPSGLMDWESLSEMQQELIDQKSVILVSAAPIFGVKLIETIQRVFTYLGMALTVDAENWMAHKGSANVILNIFKHIKTPGNFVVLSGDVHYSFVYDVYMRFRKNAPRLVQITASGVKNEFPPSLITWFDRFDRWLFHRRSPLNWFTRRRSMSIRPRHPQGRGEQTLLNHSGIGHLRIDPECKNVEASIITTKGEQVSFVKNSKT